MQERFLFGRLNIGSGLAGKVSGAIIDPTSAVVDGFRNEPDRKYAWLSHYYAYHWQPPALDSV
ncbi:hypothetical protein CSV69_13070 [Sporosarcina sp. P26b]|nr:hypothetical protein CSV69_13070 [Sporosarcina sp. P26b]